MALKGIKVIEMSGLAPAPFCGMLLSDFGASVTVINRSPENPLDVLATGKRSIALNLKNAKAQQIIRKLCATSDVLIEPYRPGVMEKLGLGPDTLMHDNPRLIYARLTGFGQTGPLSRRAGHDINYVAMSGILSMLGRRDQKPTPPINLLADMAGGGLLCAFGICTALLERHRSGHGQIVDSSMTEGAAYVSSWLTRSQRLPIWGQPRGENMLDSNAFFYDTYETRDGRYMSVGALEPQFFDAFVSAIDLPGLQQHCDVAEMAEAKRQVEEKFLEKTQQEWSDIFESIDACVFPVLDWQTAAQHKHNRFRKSFVNDDNDSAIVTPTPAPRLSRTPAESGVQHRKETNKMDELRDILREAGVRKDDEIDELAAVGALILPITLDSKL